MSAKSSIGAIALCSGFALGGCGNTSIDTVAGQDGLSNTAWQIETIEGEAVGPNSGSRVTIDDNGYVVASAGCTTFTGKATTSGNRLAVTRIDVVGTACAGSIPLQEAAMIDTLERVDRWAVQESYLLLYSEGSTVPTRLARHP
jgi:heat shock protein HslJ